MVFSVPRRRLLLAFVVVGMVLSALTAWVRLAPSASAASVAQWNVLCSIDHFAADDPIVYPGQPGRSHMHSFYGNTSTNAATTTASLQAASPSTCGRGMGTSDLSGYWVPSL